MGGKRKYERGPWVFKGRSESYISAVSRPDLHLGVIDMKLWRRCC